MYSNDKKIPRGMWWAIGGLAVLFIVGSIVSFYIFRSQAKKEIVAHADDIQSGVAALAKFDFASAASHFKAAGVSSSQMTAMGKLTGFFTNGKNPIGAFIDASQQLSVLSEIVNRSKVDMKSILPHASRNESFTKDLGELKDTLHALDADAQSLSSVTSLIGGSMIGSGDLVSLTTRLHAAESFLDAFVPWFTDAKPHHILVLFQNPAELRATGGFLGSYADVTIQAGAIENIAVHDIADADSGFTPLVVPPKPLQLEVQRWRPADANWFFDFPTSASQTIAFFEQVHIGTSSVSTSYDGVVAISPQVISDMLDVVGGIKATSSPVVFTKDNFLVEIQKIVQAGQAKGTGYPKQVLSELMQGIIGGLVSSTDAQQETLALHAQQWTGDKDIQIYFKDPIFENFVKSWDAAGDVYALPQNFEGDYVALASTNINGQKSDLYIDEEVNWQSQINLDGTVDDHLGITRTHQGDKSPYWWYQAPNQVYVELFTPRGTTLTNASGGIKKVLTPPIDYGKNGYTTVPLVMAMESSTVSVAGYPAVTKHEESGKDVFAMWSRVAGGAQASLAFDYMHRLYVSIGDGTTYHFIFDKQASTNRHYVFEIDAPLGYIFTETNLPSWTFETEEMPARLIQNLTLEKI